MKKFLSIPIVLTLLTLSACGVDREHASITKTPLVMEVLSTNIQDDKIVVGVKYFIDGREYLDDFTLLHAEAASIENDTFNVNKLTYVTTETRCYGFEYNHHNLSSKHNTTTIQIDRYTRRSCIGHIESMNDGEL